MKTALFAAAALAAAFAIAPVAQAQASCEEIERLLHESDAAFYEIKTIEVEDDLYETNFHLEGASGCSIDFAWDSVYTCYWRFPSEQAAAAFIDIQLKTMRACLSRGEWDEELLDASEPGSDWRLIAGASFTGIEAMEGLAFSARADAGQDETSEIFEVEISLAYMFL